jgi:hypothetical protein
LGVVGLQAEGMELHVRVEVILVQERLCK